MSTNNNIIVTTESELRRIVGEEVRAELAIAQRRKAERPKVDKLLLTRKEAAAKIGVSVSTLDGYVRQGLLHKINLGKRAVRFRASDVNKLAV